MKSAKELLQFDFNAEAFTRRAPKNLKIPAARIQALETIAKSQEGKGLTMPDTESLSEIYRLCLETSSDQLATVFDSPRRIRQLAWALTYSEDGLPAIVETPKFRQVLALIDNRFRMSTLPAIFYTLLKAWNTTSADLLRKFLKKHLTTYTGSRRFAQNLKANMRWYWEKDGAKRLAMFLISSKEKISNIWEYLELPAYTHNYAYFGEVATMYTTRHSEVTQEHVTDVVGFVKKHNNAKSTKRIVSELIEKLGMEASETVRASVQSYALQEWQDPRIAGADVRWRGISDKARDIFAHWITKEDIHFFFDVVAQACDDQKFEYRKTFWLAYLERITFCRPVLHKNCEYLFRHDPQALQYYRDRNPAELKGGSSNQHVFIIQMGELTFVEFSTAGACRVYDTNELPFELRDSEYNMNALRSPRFVRRVIHSNSDRYTWQREFAAWLEDEIGIESLRSYRLDNAYENLDDDIIYETPTDSDSFNVSDENLDDDIIYETIEPEIISCPNPNCRQKLRVQIVSNNVRIICPTCKTAFER